MCIRDRAYSEYVKEDSELQYATRAHELAKDLFENKAMPLKDLKQAENELVKARAEFRRAKERLLSLRVPADELTKPLDKQKITSRFEMKSPLTGVVVERAVTPGQSVGGDSSQVLFTVADLDMLQVLADLYERDLALVREGQFATVTVEEYPGVSFHATVAAIGDVVDPVRAEGAVHLLGHIATTALDGMLDPERAEEFHFRRALCHAVHFATPLKRKLYQQLAHATGRPGAALGGTTRGGQDVRGMRTGGGGVRGGGRLGGQGDGWRVGWRLRRGDGDTRERMVIGLGWRRQDRLGGYGLPLVSVAGARGDFDDVHALVQRRARQQGVRQRGLGQFLVAVGLAPQPGVLATLGGVHDGPARAQPVSYTHLRAHETVLDLVCRLLLEKKKTHEPIQAILTEVETQRT